MQTLDDVIARARSLSLPTRCIVDGKETAARDTYDNVSPRDGTLLNKVASGGAAEIDAAVRSARAAFDDRRWRGLAP